MPTLQKIYTLEITPEKFIDNCSEVELQEVILLANAKLSRHESPVSQKQVAIPSSSSPKSLPKPKPERPQPIRRTHRRWTQEEDELITKLHSTTSLKKIAEKLNRKYKVVAGRASKLGLQKRKSSKPEKDVPMATPINPKPKRTLPPIPEEIQPAKKNMKERSTDCIGAETGFYINEI
jgi:hypothetical protein